VKALSLRQPWADLVIQGKKTLELRNWTVSYRGPLAIHASLTVNEAACRSYGMQPETLTTGALIGVVELVDIIRLDTETYTARQAEHLAQGFYAPPADGKPLYGWKLSNPRELPHPVPFHGRMGLFNVPDELLDDGRDRDDGGLPSPIHHLPFEEWDARQMFELRVIPEQAKTPAQPAYRLALYQRVVEPPPAQQRLTTSAPVRMRMIAEISGSLLRAVADQILDALRQSRYQATELSSARVDPFLLPEETGVRLGLLFLAVRPINKMERVEAISMGIRAMTSEELYYWFSKCAAPEGNSAPQAARAQKALRILLSDE
jgi:hypothetical protein